MWPWGPVERMCAKRCHTHVPSAAWLLGAWLLLPAWLLECLLAASCWSAAGCEPWGSGCWPWGGGFVLANQLLLLGCFLAASRCPWLQAAGWTPWAVWRKANYKTASFKKRCNMVTLLLFLRPPMMLQEMTTVDGTFRPNVLHSF